MLHERRPSAQSGRLLHGSVHTELWNTLNEWMVTESGSVVSGGRRWDQRLAGKRHKGDSWGEVMQMFLS